MVGETKTRYRVYDKKTRGYLASPSNTAWRTDKKDAWPAETHEQAFDAAMRHALEEFRTGIVVIIPVRFRVVPSKTARELARVQAELTEANARNERLAQALREAITREIPQAEKADFMRRALGQDDIAKSSPRKAYTSALYCAHANESPDTRPCNCPSDCYCKHEGNCAPHDSRRVVR